MIETCGLYLEHVLLETGSAVGVVAREDLNKLLTTVNEKKM